MYWDNETFYVDETPPEIIKTVGDPNCTGCGEMGDDDYCVTTDTLITLDAVEQGCCPCTNVTIEYQIAFYDGEVWVWTDWINYTEPFNFTEECEHEPFNFTEECEHQLYVRAYDCLGNGLDCGCWDIETFNVDDTPPPKPEKIVGDPKVKLEDDTMGHDQWMIFPDTEINFSGFGDEGCCPCEEVTIEYRIWYLGTWTDWMIYTSNITLSGGCVHYLEARAYDCLGNRGEIDNETFWVCGPSGDSGPDIAFIEPAFGETRCDRTLEVIIDASDDETTKEDLTVIMWIPPTGNAPTLYYYPEYDPITYGDEYFHAFIDLYKYQDGTDLTLQAFAQDEDMNTEMTILYHFTVCSTIEYDQWMQKGWNQLIIPFGGISCNGSVEHVLASVYDYVDGIFHFDGASWSSFVPGEPWNPWTEMETGKTYWIYINKADGIRYYTDTNGPAVSIEYPEDGQIFDCEMLGIDIWGNASDIETGINEVVLIIHDITTDEYWTGTEWDVYTELTCVYNQSAGQWACINTQNIALIDGQEIILTARAMDMAGCTEEATITFYYECEPAECNPDVTYTTNAEFVSGTYTNTYAANDTLYLNTAESTIYPTLWIANSGDPSVSKWDTQTDKELARYQTFFGTLGSFGSHSGPAPSRTCVDTEGNCYVANRQFPSDKAADVIKIFTDDWIDRNGNGVLDTSQDTNDNGVIEPSEMLPIVDSNGNDKIDPNEIQDERIAWVVEVGPTNGLGRSLSIDLDGNLWLGLYNTKQYYKLSSVDGSILAGPIDVSPHTPYGSLVDKHGILWGASLTDNMLKLNTNNNSVIDIFSHSAYGGNYGIALGYDESDNTQVYLGSFGGYSYIEFDSLTETCSTPAEIQFTVRGISVDADGNIICGSSGGGPGSGGVAKFAPNGSLIWSAPSQVGSAEARGSVVDSDNNVWCIHVSADKISKFNGTDGAPLGWRPTGKNPYTYSDSTGIGYSGSVSTGKWSVTYDSLANGTIWNSISWNGNEPVDTNITVKVRSSDDAISWSPWETATNGNSLNTTPDGRYIQIEVTMQTTSDESPELYDLTIDGTCAGE